ncbi:neuralized-like protein 4 [Ischnura elegans]|uniref:neuralized-like protein 4 n=1 Tax=Ischnura elegans TaxID=197161 RepID=UPI001ED87F1F|nr:neuralized-like protein 4 [Ischnura elegans]
MRRSFAKAMHWSPVLVLFTLSVVTAEQKDAADGSKCAKEEKAAPSLTLSLTSWRNSEGEWVAEMSARKEVNNSMRNVSVEMEHKIFECNGKTVILMTGREVFGDHGQEIVKEEIFFNVRHGKNAFITDGGRSAIRKNPENHEGHGTLFSSRPLMDDELFEVRVASKISDWGGTSIGIGVTAIPISSFSSSTLWMMVIENQTWMMYDENIFVDGDENKENYGTSLSSLDIGDKVGVQRTSNGTLHFFVNGVDQGIAAIGIPRDVHAVVDLLRDFVAVAIV